MKLVAIESSGLVASVALLVDETIVAEYTIEHKKTHSQFLLPMLVQMMQTAETEPDELDAIAVASGPGSFTGLRIGVATAKGLGLALEKPIIPVSTLAAMAYQCIGMQGLICPILDARRNQVYAAAYHAINQQFHEVLPDQAIEIAEFLQQLEKLQQPAFFLGDGATIYRRQIEERKGISSVFALPHTAKQRAASVATLAAQYYKEGKMTTAAEQQPVYLRLSQAEREAKERAR